MLAHLKNTIKAGGSTSCAQNVEWVNGWCMEWVIPLRLLRLLEHLRCEKKPWWQPPPPNPLSMWITVISSNSFFDHGFIGGSQSGTLTFIWNRLLTGQHFRGSQIKNTLYLLMPRPDNNQVQIFCVVKSSYLAWSSPNFCCCLSKYLVLASPNIWRCPDWVVVSNGSPCQTFPRPSFVPSHLFLRG